MVAIIFSPTIYFFSFKCLPKKIIYPFLPAALDGRGLDPEYFPGRSGLFEYGSN